MTQEHMPANRTSLPGAYPEGQELSRRIEISTLLVLRGEEVRECLREGGLALHHCRDRVPHCTARATDQSTNQALVR